MSKKTIRGGTRVEANDEIHQVRDLIDFYTSWHMHRPTVIDLTGSDKISKDERLIVKWLIQLADRISDRDLMDDLNDR